MLAISWSDGATRHYPTPYLRAHCPCALCSEGDETPESIHSRSAGVRVVAVQPVGQYALQIGFSDGHRTGIYTFARLRALGFDEGKAPKPEQLPTFEV